MDSARRAGVTRQLRWVRISDQIELLDAPGVLPSKLDDQFAALKLAICDDIGEAGYDNQRVAALFVELLKDLDNTFPLQNRYGLDAQAISGEDFLHNLAEQKYKGDVERVARQLLNDFRKGILGAIALEFPPAASPVPESVAPEGSAIAPATMVLESSPAAAIAPLPAEPLSPAV